MVKHRAVVEPREIGIARRLEKRLGLGEPSTHLDVPLGRLVFRKPLLAHRAEPGRPEGGGRSPFEGNRQRSQRDHRNDGQHETSMESIDATGAPASRAVLFVPDSRVRRAVAARRLTA